jgi:hypothetical protein
MGDHSELLLQEKGLSNEKSDVTFVGVCVFGAITCSASLSGASAAQFPHHDLRSGPGSY